VSAGHFTYECRNLVKLGGQLQKEMVLDISSCSSESEEDDTPIQALRKYELDKKLKEEKKKAKKAKKDKKKKKKKDRARSRSREADRGGRSNQNRKAASSFFATEMSRGKGSAVVISSDEEGRRSRSRDKFGRMRRERSNSGDARAGRRGGGGSRRERSRS
jgi:hypothetical protein